MRLLAPLSLVVASTLSGAATLDELPPVLRPAVRVAPPAAEEFVRGVKPVHPRLLLTEARIAELRRQIKTDAASAGWMRSIRANGLHYRAKPPIDFVPEPVPGQRAQVRPMLWPGRDLVDRVSTLGLLTLLDDDEAAFQRLREEILHALSWPEWDTDIARYEIACGMALAYDWVHARWTAEERKRLEDAIVKYALNGYTTDFNAWTTKSAKTASLNRNNVNLVNNAGAAVAALAVAVERPAEAGPVLRDSFALIQVSLAAYGDDGAWFEGVNYWRFGVRHLAQYLACLDTAIGTDFGLASGPAFPGIARTAVWPLQLCSNEGRPFNFGDGDSRTLYSAPMLWLGRAFRLPEAVAYERRSTFARADDSFHRNLAREVAQRLIYHHPGEIAAGGAPLPLEAVFSGGDLAVMRSGWGDDLGFFVGVKAGSAADNRHAHLDAGTVVTDALGRRWLCEVGPGPYDKAYFGSGRYLYFQARTEGHGTLLINPETNAGGNQSESARATTRLLPAVDGEAACEVSLTDVYPGAESVTRTVRLTQRRSQLRVEDRVKLSAPGTVRWQVYTPAPKVVLARDGRSVRLSYEKSEDGPAAAAVLKLASTDPGQRFVIEPAAPLPGSPAVPIAPLPDFTRIAVVVSSSAEAVIDVELVPLGSP